MNEIGKIVKETRKKLGLDQRTLALYAGVSTKFISELESGKETVQMDKVIAVLKVFNYKLSVESEK
jgi:y4mF family transcriptional regulator